MPPTIEIDGNTMTVGALAEIARYGAKVKTSKGSLEKVSRSSDIVKEIVDSEETVYGVNTGFGALSQRKIERADLEELQENLVRSHCVGVGAPLEEEVVRGVIALRANALAKGYSGVRPVVLRTLSRMLNAGITPRIPSRGSVGASGDLIPLAHIANALCGRGSALYENKITSVREALEAEKIEPLVLGPKEGLALINGTQLMGTLGALGCFDAQNLLKNSLILGAMALEGLLATDRFLDERVHRVRPHPGQIKAAGDLKRLVADSDIIRSHAACGKIQDAYTLRCMPQILGASADVVSHAGEKVRVEMNSATDNPLIFPDTEEVISQGNFHGQPLAMALDYLSIAVAELGSWAERLTFRMLSPHLSDLPPFLTQKGGLNSGLMLTQYTSAALVSENKVLCHPASVDSIPTSASQEDHVSMGATSGLKLREIIGNTEYVIAIGLLCATQVLTFHAPSLAGKGTTKAFEHIRRAIPPVDKDRNLEGDIETLCEKVRSGQLVKDVEGDIGRFQCHWFDRKEVWQ